MKKAAFLAVALTLFAQSLPGAEKIEGAFGFEFGQNFVSTTPIIEHEKDYSYYDVYPVTPPTPNPAFVTYYVRITPVTHLLCEIIAIGKPVPGEAGVESDKAIKAYLQARYGEDSRPFADEIRQENHVILVGGAHHPGRTITNVDYIDSGLWEQAQREKSQLDAENAAEHARQLLKTFDGAGL